MSKKEYYYKISKESKTGKTFLKMMNLGVEIQDIALEYINSIGFEAYRSGYWCYLGGVSCLLDPKPDVDLSKFKRVQDGYMPNLVYTKGKEAFKHPAIFPEKLARYHIATWSQEGDIILDPMCGSGTTLKMAKLLNRSYIGIDISEEYVNLSKKRVLNIQIKN